MARPVAVAKQLGVCLAAVYPVKEQWFRRQLAGSPGLARAEPRVEKGRNAACYNSSAMATSWWGCSRTMCPSWVSSNPCF
jgi:hypothetical protein